MAEMIQCGVAMLRSLLEIWDLIMLEKVLVAVFIGMWIELDSLLGVYAC